jgi:hypothetical protein
LNDITSGPTTQLNAVRSTSGLTTVTFFCSAKINCGGSALAAVENEIAGDDGGRYYRG